MIIYFIKYLDSEHLVPETEIGAVILCEHLNISRNFSYHFWALFIPISFLGLVYTILFAMKMVRNHAVLALCLH